MRKKKKQFIKKGAKPKWQEKTVEDEEHYGVLPDRDLKKNLGCGG